MQGPEQPSNTHLQMQKYVVEFIGTFFLVLTVGCAAVLGFAGSLAPLAIGAALMVMVFAGGHVSGAHYNPAVSLAVFVRGKLAAVDLLWYAVAQLIAACLAGLITVKVLAPEIAVTALDLSLRAGPAFVAEMLFTFALAWVVLNVATTRANDGNSFYGLAIGFTVLTGAFAVGRISGGAFNPAVALGLVVMGVVVAGQVWIHIVASLVGAVAAVFAFKFVHAEDATDAD